MNDKTQKLPQILTITLFVGLSAWWALFINRTVPEDFSRYVFGATYGIMALAGGVYGLASAKKWGSFKSSVGRTILYLAIGLLLAEFGQLVFSYYNIVAKELVPYPSLADVGFFGSIPLYILGALSLGRVLNTSNNIKKNPIKLLLGIIVPLILLISSYLFFLKGYDSTEASSLTMLLDFGYPLGQAIYVSIALVILLSAIGLLGGLMRKPLILLLFAFIAQYLADFNFLYQYSQETWINGGYGDYLYLVAYFVMTLSLIKLNSVFQKTGSQSSRANAIEQSNKVQS